MKELSLHEIQADMQSIEATMRALRGQTNIPVKKRKEMNEKLSDAINILTDQYWERIDKIIKSRIVQ